MENIKLGGLGGGYVSQVDDEDFKKLNQYCWYVRRHLRRPNLLYVQRHSLKKEGNKPKIILLHRVIMNPPAGMVVDHINHDGLDNRRENLRICTNRENLCNNRGRSTKYGYKGVYRSKTKRASWVAKIKVNGKEIYLGSYRTAEDAAIAYNGGATHYNGEYATLNPAITRLEG